MNALQRHRLQAGPDPFRAQLARWNSGAIQRIDDVFEGVVEECRRSIVHGSEITGAPGQPVDTGELRDSWRVERVGISARIVTDSPYARAIEHNWRRLASRTRRNISRSLSRIRSGLKDSGFTQIKLGTRKQWERAVRSMSGGLNFRNGGAHSVKLTVASFHRIVEVVRLRHMGRAV